MRKKRVLVILVSILFVSALDNTQTIRAEISPTPTIPQQEHFIVQQTFWAFGGTYAIGSFSANSGDFIVLNISSVNVDPDRPDDRYIVELDVVSAKHGTSYVSDTQFSQTIALNYTDYYTITAEKHQFWSSVRISGELTVYHNPVPLATPSPSPSPTPSPSPSSTQQPALIVLVDSPQNKTYTTNYIPVFISASDPTKNIGPESIAYSLDGGDKQTIASVNVGAHSLNGSTGIFVPDGSHSLVAIATTWFNGADGVYRSAPIYFTINTSAPTPTASVPEFPSWIILPLIVITMLIAAITVRRKNLVDCYE